MFEDREFRLETLDKLARIEGSVEFLLMNLELQFQGQSIERLRKEIKKARLAANFQKAFSANNPMISVIIPASRPMEFIERSVESVLKQTYENLEIIVVHDSARDDIYKWRRTRNDSRIKIIHNVNPPFFGATQKYRSWAQAGGSSRNLGMKMAQGEFLTFLDDDDEMLYERIARCLHVAQKGKFEIVGHIQGKLNQKKGLESFRTKHNKTREFLSGSVDSLGLNTNSIFVHKWFKKIQWPLYNYKSMRGIDKTYINMLFLMEPRYEFIDEILVIRH